MIRNNLSILMSERGVKNSTLSLKTGISKNTISSTAQNDGKMIQLETINKICQVLDVSPNDFFSYLPFDLQISLSLNTLKVNAYRNDVYQINKIIVSDLDLDLFIQVLEKNSVTQTFEFECNQDSDWDILDPYLVATVIINSGLNKNFLAFWRDITTPFQTDIKKEIKSKLTVTIIEFLNEKIKELFEESVFEFGDSKGLLDYFSLDITSAEFGS